MTPRLLLLALCLVLCACATRPPIQPEASTAGPLDPGIKPLAKEQDEQISE